jgi:putative ABC transport system permease protein
LFAHRGCRKTLFPFGSAVGQRIKIAAISYYVVGVIEPANAGEDSQGMVVIPVTTGLNRYGRQRDLAILVQAPDEATFRGCHGRGPGRSPHHSQSPTRRGGRLRDVHERFPDPTVCEGNLRRAYGLALVSSIALLAAGVGIMNIMLVSVTERTREIGIRRAIGARKRSIMIQFIMEAIVLCEIGGLIGIVLGMIGANALAIYLLKLPPAFPVDWAIIGLVICSLIGVVFGSYPAFKAAHLDPIESLRYE